MTFEAQRATSPQPSPKIEAVDFLILAGLFDPEKPHARGGPARDRTGGSRTAPTTGVEREKRDGEPDSAVGAVREPPVTEDYEAEPGAGSRASALRPDGLPKLRCRSAFIDSLKIRRGGQKSLAQVRVSAVAAKNYFRLRACPKAKTILLPEATNTLVQRCPLFPLHLILGEGEGEVTPPAPDTTFALNQQRFKGSLPGSIFVLRPGRGLGRVARRAWTITLRPQALPLRSRPGPRCSRSKVSSGL